MGEKAGWEGLLMAFPQPMLLWDIKSGLRANLKMEELIQGEEISKVFLSDGIWEKIQETVENAGLLKIDDVVKPDGCEDKAYLASGLANGEAGLFLFNDISSFYRLLNIVTHSRNKFRTVFDALQDIVLVIDRNYIIRNANLAAARWFDIDIRELVGRSCKTIYPSCRNGNGDSSPCPAMLTFDLGKAHEIETQLYSRDDGYRWFSQISLPIKDENGKVEQVALILRDIHQIKENEQAILELNHVLEEKNKRLRELINNLRDTQAQLIQTEKMASIGQLAAGMAHEINNPIGFVYSNTKTLKEYFNDILCLIDCYRQLVKSVKQKIPNMFQDELGKIEALEDDTDVEFLSKDIPDLVNQSIEGLERVRQIVQDLKTFSHLDQADIKEIDINQAIESTLNVVWNEIKHKAKIEKDLAKDLPPVLGYPQKINQVLMNILVNAAQAIEEQGTIWIKSHKVLQPRVGIEVIIRDTGCGMSDEIRARIFDAFFTTKPVGQGTGLGLTMAYKIVKLHKGDIRVESEEGKGTTITIFLPLLTPEELQAGQNNNEIFSDNATQTWVQDLASVES